MKIAVASEGTVVSGHFGHCEGFTVYEVNQGIVEGKEFVPNPGHRPGYLPVFLHELGVKAIIAGGMGATAQDLFTENGIEVFVGVQGPCDEVMKEYAKGTLTSSGSVCTEHAHEGHCNE
ncbi:NifB/NifX family molybdenum-iron cluster-binding protein [Anaeromicropila populeti]|uniref:Predicted Fe-Mo cluster-binding protein, NifX family n=1 Tax=Anaeromicropila populeti TaxID=37658 RepID=A0A1I6K5E9_9FIRM|nr:NifB/NifX family molybdenum-iron cluster-binding protein [Anaeromicropila populeti]SFR86461.1 Predicted Fe-Mo cluster-binding protein, NifX family [Anaeromicropila populeti]